MADNCEYICDDNPKHDCSSLFDCCDCGERGGDVECCPFCYSCNACGACFEESEN